MNLVTPASVQKLQTALHAKAKGSPNFRFYSLYDKMYRRDVLEFAYECCKANGGAAGVDGQTFEDIEEYGLERWLDELAQELERRTYRPLPVRRVYIPKPDGKQRPLGVPAIRDRTAETAAVLVLEPIFEADLQPEQYAYRRDCSALDAVKHVHKLLNTGHGEIVDADLSSYFDTIPHSDLLKSVARRVVDGAMLHLIKMWLEAPVEETDERGNKHRSTRNRDEGQGTPQGAPITPRTQKAISSLKEQLWGGEKGTHCLIFVVNSNTVMSHDPLDQDAEGSPVECRSWPVAASNRASRSSTSVVTRVRLVRAPSISLLARSLPTRWTDRSSRSYCANHLEASTANRGTAAEIREKQWPDHWSDRNRRIKCISARPKKACLNRVKIATHFKFKFLICLIACSSRSSRGLTRFWCHVASTPSGRA
jgi:hypothetical protein